MKQRKTTDYALLAMVYIAQYCKDGEVFSACISKNCNIKHDYLLNSVLPPLVSAGLLRSRRGPFGGFSLALPANQISIKDILDVIEGKSRGIQPITEIAKKARFSKKMEAVCRQSDELVSHVYDRIKLTSMIE